MTGVARNLPSALLAGSQDDSQAEPILSVLGRIYDERGPFRHITEKSLEAELVADGLQESSSDSEEDEDEAGEGDEFEGKTRPEQIAAKRAEMLSLVVPAHNEVMITLDFLSLLASKDVPKQAELTMSPALKQQLKPGTLGFDMWNNVQPDREQQGTDDAIARGWRMQSLQESADSLLGAAARLEKDVRRETRYWDQVLSVSERGWSLCRMPREKHNLGVRFGFLEAHGEYRERGLAALRADELGNVVLDKGLGNNAKSIRVRTCRGSTTVGTSNAYRMPAESEATLEARIRAARDSLYEEELFHEVTRESRTLASYGVDMDQSTISFPTRLDACETHTTKSAFDRVTIDLVSPEDAVVEEEMDSSQDNWAQAIAMAFRLFLSYTHRERLKRRSDLPQPMSLKKKDAPVAQIIRPIMTILHHHSVAKEMDYYLDRLKALLAKASVETIVMTAKFDASRLEQVESMGLLMRTVMGPLHSQSSLSLRVPGRKETLDFTLHLHTSSMANILGSRITLTSAIGTPEVELDGTEDLIDYFDGVIAKALALGVASSLTGWTFNERLGVVSKASTGDKVSVEVQSGALDAEEGQLTLHTAAESISWSTEKDGNMRRFWNAVSDIK